MKRYLLLSALVAPLFGFSMIPTFAAQSQGEAEREGQVTLYTTANTSDAKAVTDGFKNAYPKIAVQFCRTANSQLMERILTEGRAGQSLWDAVSTTGSWRVLRRTATGAGVSW